jgi:hypothetical protein
LGQTQTQGSFKGALLLETPAAMFPTKRSMHLIEGSSSSLAQSKSVLIGAHKPVGPGHALSQSGNQRLAIDLLSEASPNALQQFGNMQGMSGLIKYVKSHINL